MGEGAGPQYARSEHMPEKDRAARVLAAAHRETEPGIVRIVQLVSQNEASPHEPVKLLEVNPATSPSGVMPIAFAPDPPDVPFPSIIVEATPDEYERIANGQLSLPEAWRLGLTLYDAEATG